MYRKIFSRKIGDTKEISHAKMGTINDRNSMDITEAEDIQKRWQENTEKLYKKGLNDLDQPRQCGHSPRATHPRA